MINIFENQFGFMLAKLSMNDISCSKTTKAEI